MKSSNGNTEAECVGCLFLEREDWPRGAAVAVCTDPDKRARGARRVVLYSDTGKLINIRRPVWCQGKKTKENEP